MSNLNNFSIGLSKHLATQMQDGTAPWQVINGNEENIPMQNLTTGQLYHGINRLILAMQSETQGYSDPRWLTAIQAEKAGINLKDREKGTNIFFFQYYNKNNEVLDKPIMRTFTLYNAEQMENVPTLEVNKAKIDSGKTQEMQQVLDTIKASVTSAQDTLATDIASWMLKQELGTTHSPVTNQEQVNAMASMLEKNPFAIIKIVQNAEDLRKQVLENALSNTVDLARADEVKQTLEPRLAEEKTVLLVPFKEKEEAKEHGAKWDMEEKTWYAPEGTDLALLEKWIVKQEKEQIQTQAQEQVQTVRGEVIPKEARIYIDCPKEEREQAKELGARWDRDEMSWYSNADNPKHKELVGIFPIKEKQKEMTNEALKKNDNSIRTYLDVPFENKDEVKDLGARWDGDNKAWYAPEGADLAALEKWIPSQEKVMSIATEKMSPEAEFGQVLREAGLDVENPIMDGTIHRVPLIGGKANKMDGAYSGFLDDVPAGWAKNFVTGEDIKFTSSQKNQNISQENREKMEAERIQKLQAREVERVKQHAVVAKQAKEIYQFQSNNVLPIAHPYLEKKGIQPFSAKMDMNTKQLIVPIQNINNEIRGVQFINEDGSKYFQKGMEKKGNFALIGKHDENSKQILVCEGFATGASLHEATNLPVAVAFDAGNLKPVSEKIRNKYDNIKIYICADNDHTKEVNVGMEKAKDAVQTVNGILKFPKVKEVGMTDFNDVHKKFGLNGVRKQLSIQIEKKQDVTLEKTKSLVLGK